MNNMETKKPVALWKGIVGTAVSGFVLVLVFVIFLFLYLYNKILPDWAIIWILVAFVLGMISLILGIINIRGAVEYNKQNKSTTQINTKKNDTAKSELLHRLLSEGKITIEEYDELNK